MPKKKQDADLVDEFIIERYKYILNEIHSLNDNFHKFLSVFQTLATGIIGGAVAFLATWKSMNLTASTAISILRSLEGLLILLSVFILLSLLAGMFSWFDYRKEETELLNKVVEPNFRKPPKWRNLWRWIETYLILFLIIFVVLVSVYLETQIIPSIK